MAIVTQIGKIGAGVGSGKAWKVSYNKQTSEVKIGYGTMFYNGKFLTTNDILKGTVKSGIGTDQKIFLGVAGTYVMLHIYNALNLPSDTGDSAIKIDIDSETDGPDTKNKNAPLTEYIPLAYVDSEGKVYDMRPTFWVNNFPFLAPSSTLT